MAGADAEHFSRREEMRIDMLYKEHRQGENRPRMHRLYDVSMLINVSEDRFVVEFDNGRRVAFKISDFEIVAHNCVLFSLPYIKDGKWVR